MLRAVMDMDELMALWRLRHALMVSRMIGRKVGTGGSSGADYLRGSADKHRIFTDLFSIATFLIPRSQLPRLPETVRASMRYAYERA
jgi:tryptophan 2,3-dioxygenase